MVFGLGLYMKGGVFKVRPAHPFMNILKLPPPALEGRQNMLILEMLIHSFLKIFLVYTPKIIEGPVQHN